MGALVEVAWDVAVGVPVGLGAAVDVAVGLASGDGVAGAGERVGGRHAAQSAADHDDVVAVTKAFSLEVMSDLRTGFVSFRHGTYSFLHASGRAFSTSTLIS